MVGRLGWRARYLKEVDAQEITLRFWQEIYDEQGKLVEPHGRARGAFHYARGAKS